MKSTSKVKTSVHKKGKTINRIKIQHIKREKIFANYISDKELISRMYKEYLKLNNQKNHTT